MQGFCVLFSMGELKGYLSKIEQRIMKSCIFQVKYRTLCAGWKSRAVWNTLGWLLDVVRNQFKCSGNLSLSFQIISSKPQVFLQKKK